MLLFSLETSCDETSASILNFEKKGSFRVLSNQISSQIKLHAKWGGVVPNLAAREHSKNILPVVKTAFKEAGVKPEDIDALCVTAGPGLIPALLIGVNVAKTLAYFYQKPLIGIHHIEGHIYSNFINKNKRNLNQFDFPVLNLVISGGHTQLILMRNHLEYEIIGETQDDAVGEAFDKVGKMLDFEYPGGPIVSREASDAEELIKNKQAEDRHLEIKFPRPMLNSGDLNFSFSGLKTSVLYFYQKLLKENPTKSELILWKKFIAKAFQDAVVDVLKNKILKATEIYQPKTVLLSGGVSANDKIIKTLKKELKTNHPEIVFHSPEKSFCGDNAAMIGVAGIARFLYSKNKKPFQTNWKDLEADSNLKLKDLD